MAVYPGFKDAWDFASAAKEEMMKEVFQKGTCVSEKWSLREAFFTLLLKIKAQNKFRFDATTRRKLRFLQIKFALKKMRDQSAQAHYRYNLLLPSFNVWCRHSRLTVWRYHGLAEPSIEINLLFHGIPLLFT